MIFVLTIALALVCRSSTVSASYQQRDRYSNVLGVSIGQLSEKYNFLLCEQARCKQSFCGLVRNIGQVRSSSPTFSDLFLLTNIDQDFLCSPTFSRSTIILLMKIDPVFWSWPKKILNQFSQKGGVHLNPNEKNPRGQSLTRERKWTQCETYCWNIYWGEGGG